MLKLTTGAAAALTVGVGSAGARQGGSGLIWSDTWDEHEHDRFQIVEERSIWRFACRGNNHDKAWRCYWIRFEGEDHTHTLWVNPDRRLDTGEEWHEFTENELGCKHNSRVKVSFKPYTENQGNGNGGNGNRGR